MSKVKAVNYDDLPVGVAWKECKGDSDNLICVTGLDGIIRWLDSESEAYTTSFKGRTVYILDEEPEKKWPEKMILVCRTEAELKRLQQCFSEFCQHRKFADLKMPYCARILGGTYQSSDSYESYNDSMKRGGYTGYTFIEASDYFGLKPEPVTGVDMAKGESKTVVMTVDCFDSFKQLSEHEDKKIIEKGNTMSAYQVRAILKAENRAGVGMIPLKEVLPIMTVDADGSTNAAFLAGQKSSPIDEAESHRLQVTVKAFE